MESLIKYSVSWNTVFFIPSVCMYVCVSRKSPFVRKFWPHRLTPERPGEPLILKQSRTAAGQRQQLRSYRYPLKFKSCQKCKSCHLANSSLHMGSNFHSSNVFNSPRMEHGFRAAALWNEGKLIILSQFQVFASTVPFMLVVYFVAKTLVIDELECWYEPNVLSVLREKRCDFASSKRRLRLEPYLPSY